MEYVKMPELLSNEATKVLANNMDAIRDMISARGDNSVCSDDICCPKKLKFIFVLNNVVIVNVNAVAAEEDGKKPRPC